MDHKGGINCFHLLRCALVLYLLLSTMSPQPSLAVAQHRASGATAYRLSAQDQAFLEDLSRRSFRFFWENADPDTGLVRDRARTDGSPHEAKYRYISSIASTGFGLTALCIAAERRWIEREEARERVRRTLRFLAEKMPHHKGWFYHFVNMKTGERE